ncbi:MAG TPA: GNAT family N-acetyltransferase [Casimicrobiaceae bacterium]|nr:GNAT family N-acetyltransferase [Casimicrobiaceae bacterium]
MRIERYKPDDAVSWNAFVRASKNGTFLFERGYMDYHADRFRDHSLLVRDERDRLAAVIPGHEDDVHFVSHAGLTFGGVVSGRSMTTPMMLKVFDSACRYLADRGFASWRYKTIPYVYHQQPADEDRYALFRADAKLYRVDVLSVIPMRARIELQERRRRRIKYAERLGLRAHRSTDFAGFWSLLEANLASRHEVRPVHALSEIQLLHARFPEAIRLHLCTEANELVAGVVVYDSPRVAHVQYIAASPRGRETGALDLLLARLIDDEYATREYFDLGSSNEDQGRILNQGLIDQKEGFGARSVAHQFFELLL